MTNLYHVLGRYPALEKEEMFVELEELATELVESGRLRIDAFNKANFVRFFLPYQRVSMTFSERELYDPHLLPLTERIISYHYKNKFHGEDLKKKVQSEIARLKAELKKFQKVSPELEKKIARVVVQSAHPAVIKLIILENVELYVSYSYNIGDVLDVISWQESGSNSGMQSTDIRQTAIFVSSGGDPFAETEKDSIYGDGTPAIARIMAIGGQEIGHFSDILRGPDGRYVGRHSANMRTGAAKLNVAAGRLNDIKTIQSCRANLQKIGLHKLAEIERHIKFFKKTNRGGLVYYKAILQKIIARAIFVHRAKKYPIVKYASKEKHIASMLISLMNDMEFNLSPKADAYDRQDPVLQEGIWCIEALARIPQQVNKWGKHFTRSLMPGLFDIYFNQVIPACIATVEARTHKKYDFKLHKKFYFLYWLKNLKNIFKKKKYYVTWDL